MVIRFFINNQRNQGNGSFSEPHPTPRNKVANEFDTVCFHETLIFSGLRAKF